MVQHSLFTFGSPALLAVCIGAFLCLGLAAQAQAQAPSPSVAGPAAQSGRPDPLEALNPQAAVPASTYLSSFAQYRTLGSQELISWRQANENVARIGGWRVYLRQSQQPETSPTPPLLVPHAQPAEYSPAEHPVKMDPVSPKLKPKPKPEPGLEPSPKAGHGGHGHHGHHKP